MRLPISLYRRKRYLAFKQNSQFLKHNHKKGVVSLVRNTLVILNPERVVSLNRNQVVSLSGISNFSSFPLFWFRKVKLVICALLHQISNWLICLDVWDTSEQLPMRIVNDFKSRVTFLSLMIAWNWVFLIFHDIISTNLKSINYPLLFTKLVILER